MEVKVLCPNSFTAAELVYAIPLGHLRILENLQEVCWSTNKEFELYQFLLYIDFYRRELRVLVVRAGVTLSRKSELLPCISPLSHVKSKTK